MAGFLGRTLERELLRRWIVEDGSRLVAITALGGTGKTGTRIASLLTGRGLSVRTGARHGADVAFDWDDPATHPLAVEGIDRLYLVAPVMRTRFARQVSAFLDLAEAAGVHARLHYRRVNRATVNDPEMAELVIETAARLLGSDNVETNTRTLGGEDMSVFLDRVPGCFFFVGSAPAGGHRPHHSPRFDFDERALAIGTALFEAVAREAARRT